MSTTDRQYLKAQQAGALTTSGATNAVGEVSNAHSRTVQILKTGTENAATNVAEYFAAYVKRKANVRSVDFMSATSVANDSTNYAVISVYQGASATVVASWNTHTSAQGAITGKAVASMPLSSTAANLAVAANTSLSYGIKKYGSGQLVDVGVIAVDLEEV